jgi:hypothetical protein
VGFVNRDITGGIVGYYRDNGEPYHAIDCTVDGVRCLADEARFGGIVVQAVETPGVKSKRHNGKPVSHDFVPARMSEYCETLWNTRARTVHRFRGAWFGFKEADVCLADESRKGT